MSEQSVRAAYTEYRKVLERNQITKMGPPEAAKDAVPPWFDEFLSLIPHVDR